MNHQLSTIAHQHPARRFATVCSGIGAPEVAAEPLGWEAVFSSDIEDFPNAVRAHHWPAVPNLGDMTKYEQWTHPCSCHDQHDGQQGKQCGGGESSDELHPDEGVRERIRRSRSFNYEKGKCQTCGGYGIDVLIGGTPCQSFSVAGLRGGLDDARGQLMLTFVDIAARYRPGWFLWENVPGVLSSNGGKDFAAFLGAVTGTEVRVPAEGWANAGWLAGIPAAYGIAWRVLDAQYFGVAQRRRRVFVVGHIGGLWQRAAAVLFERESLRGDPAPRRETGKRITKGFECGPQGGRFTDLAPTMDARAKDGVMRNQLGVGVMEARSQKSEVRSSAIPLQEVSKRTGRSTEDKACGIGIGREGDAMFTLQRGTQHGVAYGLDQELNGKEELMGTLKSKMHSGGFEGVVITPNKEINSDVTHALSGEGFDASEDGTGRGTPLVPEFTGPINAGISKGMRGSEGVDSHWMVPEVCGTLSDGAHNGGGLNGQDAYTGRIIPALGIPGNWIGRKPENGGNATEPMHEVAPNLTKTDRHGVSHGMAVRRLTPRECERLQGFPDDFTLITIRNKPAADGPRYKALGNSMAVPNIRWILSRMDFVDYLTASAFAELRRDKESGNTESEK